MSSIDNLFNNGDSVCIGTICNKPEYTREFNNLKRSFDCRRKCNDILNSLHSFNTEEKREILKSLLLQI
jgi:hypothetical protein